LPAGDVLAESKTFKCRKCGKRKKAAGAPECCGGKMDQLPLDVCTTASGPEHSRPMQDDEPCDDSRGG
jgi:hypothetical protein